MYENMEIKEDGRLSSTELRLVQNLSNKPEALDSLDRDSLVTLVTALENEKNLYLARGNVKEASKKYVKNLFEGVISYINTKITDDDKLDYKGADIEENVSRHHYTKLDIIYGKEKLTEVGEFFEFNKDVNKYKIQDIIAPGLTFRYVAGPDNLNKMKAGEESIVTWGEEINGKKTYIFLDGPKKGQRCLVLGGDAIKPSQPEDIQKVDEIKLKKEEQIKNFGHTVGLESFMSDMKNKFFTNLDRNDRNYGRKYIANTEKVLTKEMSEDAKARLETVKGLSEDEFMQGFDKFSPSLKKIMEKEFPTIQRALIAGSERLMKNAGEDFDDKTHFTIYIPNKDRRLSVGISFDPIEGFTTFPIGYGMRGFGDREGSKETPLGTFKKEKIRLAHNKYGNLGYHSNSIRGARVDIKGLEEGLNTTTSARGVLLHGVTRDREERLSTGQGYTPRSWGCIVSPTEIARNIASEQKGEKAYYEIMPPIS